MKSVDTNLMRNGGRMAAFYDVVPVGTQWAMKVAGHDQAWYYPTQDEALTVAIDAARTIWQRNGIRSVVRVQQGDGAWQRKLAFGNDTPALTSNTSPT
jgi:hypothetical protein